MSLLTVMVKFCVSAYLAYSAKGIDLRQTLVSMLMSRYFVDVINICNHLTLKKVDYPRQHLQSIEGNRFPIEERILHQDLNRNPR